MFVASPWHHRCDSRRRLAVTLRTCDQHRNSSHASPSSTCTTAALAALPGSLIPSASVSTSITSAPIPALGSVLLLGNFLPFCLQLSLLSAFPLPWVIPPSPSISRRHTRVLSRAMVHPRLPPCVRSRVNEELLFTHWALPQGIFSFLLVLSRIPSWGVFHPHNGQLIPAIRGFAHCTASFLLCVLLTFLFQR